MKPPAALDERKAETKRTISLLDNVVVTLKQRQHALCHFAIFGLQARFEQVEQVIERERLIGYRENIQKSQSEWAFIWRVVGINPLAVVTKVPSVLWVREAGIYNLANARLVHLATALHHLVNDVVDEVGDAVHSGSNRLSSCMSVFCWDTLPFQQPPR